MSQINSDPPFVEPGGRALPERALVGQIVGAFFDTYNELGHGLRESVYAAALEIVLTERGDAVVREHTLLVHFHGRTIGMFRADMIVDQRVAVENKAGSALPVGSQEQLINYLRLSRIEVGVLLFFGPKPQFKRLVVSRGRG